ALGAGRRPKDLSCLLTFFSPRSELKKICCLQQYAEFRVHRILAKMQMLIIYDEKKGLFVDH
ncbi:MAG: hypothetical protein VXW29_12210, partial [SAR324 cluster bacterium]|nr:hypothetical protein [SAR324 cluster bacterium]